MKNIKSNKRKRERLKINNINDFKSALKSEGYKVSQLDDNKFKIIISEIFSLNKEIIDKIFEVFDDEITYRADNISDFIDYIEKIILFEKLQQILYSKISHIKKIYIDRVEYDRVLSVQDDVEHILKVIKEIKGKISSIITKEEKEKIYKLEKEVDESYVYTKDIELLKKMIINNENVKENYNEETQVKTLFIEIPKEINNEYIPAKKGSVEYHNHINNNIPRIQRLIRNIDKYMIDHEDEKATYKINQSQAVQDTINIAIAIYDNKEFKAVSGSNIIEGCCQSPELKKAAFQSCKVNKLGRLGIGYNRVNDSEKKILEEIHKQIKEKKLSDRGELVIYSKWEPCPSCYYVIYQFCRMYPDINVQVKYGSRYGE